MINKSQCGCTDDHLCDTACTLLNTLNRKAGAAAYSVHRTKALIGKDELGRPVPGFSFLPNKSAYDEALSRRDGIAKKVVP